MENNLRGQITRRACELLDENNRLVRMIFGLCSASVSNNSTDKLTDTTKLDGEHKKLLCGARYTFHCFFLRRILLKNEGEDPSGEVSSVVFADSLGKTPKRGHEDNRRPLIYIN